MSQKNSQISSLSKMEAIRQLMPFVEQAQGKKGFSFEEASYLDRALRYFATEEGDEKPVVDERIEDQELAAINLLFKAVHVGNERAAYSIPQGAALFELLVHIKQLYESKDSEGKPSKSSQKTTLKANTKKPVQQLEDVEEESEHSEEEEQESFVPAATSVRRGKK